MIEIIIWLAAFFCPNPTHTCENHGNCNLIHVTVSAIGDDTGGETGGGPNPPVTPPPPPPPPVGGN